MNHGSLFSGGGGFDLAAEMMGWNNVFHTEWNPFCQKLLNYYWPNAESYSDIRQFDATKFNGKIDIITGGFPCQPFSAAGKRKGTEDTRYLWPEMLRIIQEVRPRWVVGENVYGIINWNGGMVFEQVQADLESCGYEVRPFVLPAIAVNAPHRRDRVWFIANAANSQPWTQKRKDYPRKEEKSTLNWKVLCNEPGRSCYPQSFTSPETCKYEPTYFERFPSQSPIYCRNDGFPTKLDGIAIPKWHNETIKMYGNAIVPSVALQIFTVIDIIERETT